MKNFRHDAKIKKLVSCEWGEAMFLLRNCWGLGGHNIDSLNWECNVKSDVGLGGCSGGCSGGYNEEV